jgi:hypothetical protein
MVIVERTWAGCGHRFRVDRDQPDRFCSGICAGQPSPWSLIAAAQQAARVSGRR